MKMMRRLPLIASLFASALLAGAPAASAPGDASPSFLEAAREFMQQRQPGRAVPLLEGKAAATSPDAEAAYLAALARAQEGDLAGAIKAAEKVAGQTHSPWQHKAVFLKARALYDLKRFPEAEALYEAEANRLLAPARKQALAEVVVRVADELAKDPDPARPDAPKPDYAKAHALYTRALDMQISREFRDDLLVKRGLALQKAGQHPQAAREYADYLAEYDPDWTGASAGAARLRPENPPPPGRHRLDVRLRLAEAQFAAGQVPAARRELEDLLRLAEAGTNAPAAAPALAADARWLLTRTYRIPAPAAPELDPALGALRAFLERHTADPRAVRAAFELAETLGQAGRSDAAIQAYEAFLADSGFRLPEGDAAARPDSELKKSPAELNAEWKPLALFRIGQIRFAQGRYDEAIAQYQAYAARHPSGPHWAASQEGIINAEFHRALRALADRRGNEARTLFDQFLAAHPLDARARQILFLFGQTHVARAEELEAAQGKPADIAAAFRQAIEEWGRLISKYPDSEESSVALYRTAQLHEEKLGELDQALAAYRRLTWGSRAALAAQRVGILTRKELSLSTPRTFRTTEPATVRLKVRNIPKLTIKLYRIDLEAYFRKTHGIGGVDGLDTGLIQPDRTFELVPDAYARYRPLEQDLVIPFEAGKPGAYVVSASEEDWEATTLVVRSDLDLIVKGSRREALVFVQDRVKEQAAAGVTVLLSDGAAVLTNGLTGADGIWRRACPELKDAGSARVFASKDGHIAARSADLTGLGLSTGLAPRGYLYTDRPVYRPGWTVSLRGILRDVRDGVYILPTNQLFRLAVTDPKGRVIREEEVRPGDFGTFHTAFALPAAAAEGDYTVTARAERRGREPLSFAGTFLVKSVQPEKIRLSLTFPRQVYARGEPVEASLLAEYYWGEPVAGKPVRVILPDGRAATGQTDARGRFELTFDTAPMTPGMPLVFHASLEGENVTRREAVMLAVHGFSLDVTPARDVALAGEPVEVTVRATSADGKPAAEAVTLAVLRREAPVPDRVLVMIPWLELPPAQPAEVTVQELQLRTDPVTGLATHTLTLEKGGDYTLRAAGQDRLGQVVTGAGGLRVSDDADAVKLRLFAESATLRVGGRADLRLHSRLARGLALVTHEGEDILQARVVPLKAGYQDLGFEVGHTHFPNVRVAVAAMDDRDLRQAAREFTVERELKVSVKPLQETCLPGAQAPVELLVTDQLGRPVQAELSLALAEEGLFAAVPDATPAILAFFQKDARRHAEFRTDSSCAFAYAGVTRPVAKAITEELERRERQDEEAAMLELRKSEAELAQKKLEERSQALYRRKRLDQTGQEEVNQRLAEARDNLARPHNEVATDLLLDRPVGAGGRSAGRAGNGFLGNIPLASAPHDADAFYSEISEPLPLAEPRRDLPDEVRWFPAIVTDANGKATVNVPLPAKTTEWRLTARGCTADTLVGEARSRALTRKDFFVELKVPAGAQEGDTLRPVARLHNLAGYAGPVRLTLSVAGEGPDAPRVLTRETTVNVASNAGAELTLDPIEVGTVSRLALTLEARAGGLTDAITTDLPVRPYGLSYAAHGGGAAASDTALSLELPAGLRITSRWLILALGPSLQRTVLDLALSDAMPPFLGGPALPDFRSPAGATDAGELLAKTAGLAYARKTAAPDEDARRLLESARGLVAALVAAQRDDGGWAWVGKAGSDWGASAQAYWALVEARDLGLAVHADTLQKAQAFLQGQLQSFGATDHAPKATVLHALSANKAADFAPCNRLYRDRNTLDNAALAQLALAFQNLDRADIAGELLDLLEARGEAVKDAAPPRLSWEAKSPHPWLNDRLETTALVLLALSRGRPGSPRAEQAAAFLLNARGCFGITPAKARGPVVAALAGWFGQGKLADTDGRIAVQVNGRAVTNLAVRGASASVALAVPAGLLQDGRNLIEFRVEGRVRFTYAATLLGFSPDLKDPNTLPEYYRYTRRYVHAQLEYRGKPIGAASTSPVRNLETGARTSVRLDITHAHRYGAPGYAVIEEPLPAGASLVEGSVGGACAHVETTPSSIRFFLTPGQSVQPLWYELVGYAPGEFRVLPTVLSDTLNPARMRLGAASELAVLGPGETTPDPFQINEGELFQLGRLSFEDGLYGQALEHLTALFKRNRQYNERDTARMLLWIHTQPEYADARKVVEMFEILRERYPDLEIPFDKILVVGRAYRDIGEFERACLIYRAAMSASFASDSNVSAVLQDEGRLLASIAYQARLCLEYPDAAEVVSSELALAQTLAQKALEAHRLPREDDVAPEKIAMLTRAAAMLSSFLARYPSDPLADDAAFALCNTCLDLKAFPRVVELSGQCATLYTNGPLTGAFQYMQALGLFWQQDFDRALAAARVVADDDGPDRDYARYIMGQIHHARGRPAEAIAWYARVQDLYPDAAEAIRYFTDKRIALDEVTTVKPGVPAEVTLRYRNIREAFLQVYRVDLMKLYLREKNLSGITSVKLAGIRPELELTIPLGDGRDYVEKEKAVRLALKDEAAYLVIVRGDDLFASGLALITPLKLEVQEDPASGRVRANVLDAAKAGYRPGVHVKAIGSADAEFKGGDTDLRGIFVADGLRGRATVIAREGDSRYAFYRGESWLGAVAPHPQPPAQPTDAQQSLDFQGNLRAMQMEQQKSNAFQFDQLRRGQQKGVKVQAAF